MTPDGTIQASEAELLQRGSDLFQAGDEDGALAAFRAGAERFPRSWRFRCNAATVLRKRGDVGAALRTLSEALRLAPDELLLHHKMSGWLLEIGQFEPAIRVLERAVELCDDRQPALLHLAVAYMDAKRDDRARETVERVLADDPDCADAHALRGLILGAQGRRDEGDAELRRALALDPACALAAYHLSRRTDVAPEPLAARLKRKDASEAERAKLHFALGNVHDRRGEPGAAFAHYARGNALSQPLWRPERHSAIVDDLIATCTRDFFAERADPAPAGDAPIFVVGLPRTGSTLLEQILAEHPDVHAIGEHSHGVPRLARRLASVRDGVRPYPAGLGDLAPADRATLAADYRASLPSPPGGRRVCDKLLANYQALGLIALLFPDAKVLDCRRDPRDSALSTFFLQFQRDELPWSYDLDHVVRYYRDYARLMEHWREHLPLDVLPVPYEELVGAPEAWTRRVLDFLGLPWDERCLRFDGAARTVYTASAFQVRERPHRRAIARWRPYEPFLGPLADVAREWGYA